MFAKIGNLLEKKCHKHTCTKPELKLSPSVEEKTILDRRSIEGYKTWVRLDRMEISGWGML